MRQSAWTVVPEFGDGDGLRFQHRLRRSPACESAAPGPHGRVSGNWRRVCANTRSRGPCRVRRLRGARQHERRRLVDLLNDAAGDHFVYRGLDAAARAVLQEGYDEPLLRLYAQRLKEDEAYFDIPASEYSAGCTWPCRALTTRSSLKWVPAPRHGRSSCRTRKSRSHRQRSAPSRSRSGSRRTRTRRPTARAWTGRARPSPSHP